MADVKTSALPAVSGSVNDTDLLAIVQPAGTRKATVAQLFSGRSGGTTYTDEQAQDAAAALFAAGTHSGISFVYDDSGNRISATVTATGGSNGLTVVDNGDYVTISGAGVVDNGDYATITY